MSVPKADPLCYQKLVNEQQIRTTSKPSLPGPSNFNGTKDQQFCSQNAAVDVNGADGILQHVHLNLETVLQPALSVDIKSQQQVDIQPTRCNTKPSKTGPWSLDWLAQIPAKPTDKAVSASGRKGADNFIFAASAEPSRRVREFDNKTVKMFKHSAGFVKHIARLPSADRRAILKILKKNKKKKIVCDASSKAKKASVPTVEISNNSSSSVNNDWVNWVAVHESSNGVKEDVKELGKVLGVKFKSDPNNRFNLLSKEGRKEWRSLGGVGGSSLEEGGVC